MVGGFPLGFGRTVLARVMRRLSGGSARDRFARQPAPRGRWFLRFVEEPDVFAARKPLAGGCPRTPERHPRAMSTGTEMSRFGVRARKGRGAPGQDRRSDCARGPSGHRRPLGHRGRAHTRFRGSIIHREGCRVPLPEVRNRGYSYPSGGRVRALQAILWPRIPPDHPQNAQNRRESGFPGLIRLRGAPGPPGRPGTRPRADPDGLAGRDRVRGWRVRPGSRRPDRRPRMGSARPRPRRRAGKPRGQRGRGPPPASAGDARSVAPRGKRITGGQNHGKRSRKSNWDCTICVSCRWGVSGCVVRKWLENSYRMAGNAGRIKIDS